MTSTKSSTAEPLRRWVPVPKYSDDQPRDDSGRWTDGGSGEDGGNGGEDESGSHARFPAGLSQDGKTSLNSWIIGQAGMERIKLDEERGEDSAWVRGWNEALDKSPEAKAGDYFRGIGGLSEEDVDAMTKPGSSIALKSSMSYTPVAHTAERFADRNTFQGETFVIVQISADKKSGLRDISPWNKYGEKEVIARPGTVVRVIGAEEIKIGSKYGYKVTAVLDK